MIPRPSLLPKMNKFCAILALASIIGSAAGLSCESPKTSVMSYVASDAQVLTHAPFIAQFSLTCNGKAVNDLPLYYANKADGGFVQVARSKDGSQYQLGWTVEVKSAKPADFSIDLYDEDGYSALKRSTERGTGAEEVKPLTSITIHYSGSYKGPYFASEMIALVVSFLVVYFAYTHQSKLLA